MLPGSHRSTVQPFRCRVGHPRPPRHAASGGFVPDVFTHRIFTVETFPVEVGDDVREYVRLKVSDWTNCVAVTTAGEVVLVRQYRHGIQVQTLEVPGGIVDPGEEPAFASARELREETGYGGGRRVDLGWVWANPAIQTNRTHLYAFVGVERVGEPDPDPSEDIEVVLVPGTQVQRLLDDETVTHSLAVVALQRALLKGLVPG